MSDSSREHQAVSERQALAAIRKLRQRVEELERGAAEPVAIVGLACRFPGAPDAARFWELLRDGVDAVRTVPADRWDIDAYYDPDPEAVGKQITRLGGFIDSVDRFDPDFFGIAPREAVSIDPQHRLLLEVAWEALEHAGLSAQKLAATRTGVYVGISVQDYWQLQMKRCGVEALNAYFGIGNVLSAAAGRLSYLLGLQGPSMSLDTACSSSLVALHLACQGLHSGDCKTAIVGGVNLLLTPEVTVALSRAHMLAPDGRCKTFDAAADGYVRGEGCGVVVVKRLSTARADGDRILAVIRGTAVNQDGRSGGFTAPNEISQRQLIQEALSRAGLRASDIDYVEAHGTGTSLGDPIEIQALASALGEGRAADRPLIVGSVKTNIGHLESAAGIAGLIKTVLAMEHGQIPPHLHFKTLNPHISSGNFPWTVPTGLETWQAASGRRRAGISSFGFTGTNAHVILENAEHDASTVPPDQHVTERPVHLLTLSARTHTALAEAVGRHVRWMDASSDARLADACFTANTGRSHFEHRVAVTGTSIEAVRDQLTKWLRGQETPALSSGAVKPGTSLEVAFLFAGQGSQYVGMSRQLYGTQPVFRASIDRSEEILLPVIGRRLTELIYAEPSPSPLLDDTAFTQPALFAVEYALVELWRSWGIEPAAVMGHSLGEDVAACVAGVFGLEDGLRMVAARGRLMQGLPDNGAMAAVLADEARVRDAVARHSGDVSIAAINGPENFVVSGLRDAVDAVLAELQRGGAKVRLLRCSRACHSRLMDPVLGDVERLASAMNRSEPEISFVSTVTGGEVSREELMTPDYWRRHVREAVRFSDAVETLVAKGHRIFVEIGPGSTVITMGRRAVEQDGTLWLPSISAARDVETMLGSLGTLYAHGAAVDWAAFDAPFKRSKVVLPTYPFQRQRYWVETTDGPATSQVRPAPSVCTIAWKDDDRVEAAAAVPNDWFIVASSPIDGERLSSALKAQGARPILAAIDPFNPSEVREALNAAVETTGGALNVVYLAGRVSAEAEEGIDARVRAHCAGVLHLVQAMAAAPSSVARLSIVTEKAYRVLDTDVIGLEQTPLIGMAATIAREHPELGCRHIDIESVEGCDSLVDELSRDSGENRVALRGSRRLTPRLANAETAQSRPLDIRAGAAYLITGGCGGLGLSVADWLIDRGARHLVLTGRRGAAGEAAARVEAMRARGAQVDVARGDVSDEVFISSLLDTIARGPAPLAGIVHAAGVLDDGAIGSQSWERFERVLAPKVRGAWLLHAKTRGLALDFFVMFSSAASVLGTPGQVNYAAANAFLDGLADLRRHAGLPVLSIAWGPWAEAGMAAALGDREKARWAAQGIGLLSSAEALDTLRSLLSSSAWQVLVLSANWPTLHASLASSGTALLQDFGGDSASGDASGLTRSEIERAPVDSRPALVMAHVREQAARVLGLESASSLDVHRGLRDLGLDSLMSLELRNRLQRSLAVALPATVAFDFPTVDALSAHLAAQLSNAPSPVAGATRTRRAASVRNTGDRDRAEPIAIVGMACRLPGDADSPEALWQMLRGGVDAITEVPADRWDVDEFYHPDPSQPGRMYTRFGGFVKGIDRFEPQFFGIAPREAITMDPQQRLLLEVAWEALERAGQSPARLAGTPTGVFAGVASADYTEILKQHPSEDLDAYFGTGTAASVAAGRISYVLGLQGPSMVVDTACSSSLVAVHLACQSLRQEECTLAIAGGVNAILSPHGNIALSRARMMAPDGRCKTFDASADGYVRSEGCGIVVLKRLSEARADGDQVLAVILGSAVNQDGRSSGLTAPNGPSQEMLLRKALENAGVKPAEVDYVEAHGTGTTLGDPIELQGIGAVYGEGRTSGNPVRVGSIKTNVGHLEAAAGVAGLIKVVLSLQHEEIPPHLHLQNPNPLIDWPRLPVSVPISPEPWPAQSASRRIAGVSSFGFSGTNAHLVVSSVQDLEPAAEVPARPCHVLTLSARTETALQQLTRGFAEHLLAHEDLRVSDVCFTANTGRAHLQHRATFVASTTAELRARLNEALTGTLSPGSTAGVVPDGERPGVAFLFTGQGSQYAGMGRRLYETQPTFRDSLDRSAEILRPLLDRPLLSVLYPSGQGAAAIDETAFTQPALFAFEYALAELWRSWGVVPAAVLGHSVGEYVAACVAGVFSPEDGLRLIAARGRLMQSLPRIGQMAAVLGDTRQVGEVVAQFGDRLSIAAENGPGNVVISGDTQAVSEAIEHFASRGVVSQRLAVSHAFHSALMEPILDEFRAVAAGVTFNAPRIDIVSNVTGAFAGAGELSMPEYWVRHLRQTVRFADGIARLREKGYRLFLEAGPNPVLIGMARRQISDADVRWMPSLRTGADEWKQMLETVGALYVNGVDIDWEGFDRDYPARKVVLPTYPFERERYWVDVSRQPARSRAPESAAARASRPLAASESSRDIGRYQIEWVQVPAVQADVRRDAGAVLVFADADGLGERFASVARARGRRVLLVARNDAYHQAGSDSWSIRPQMPGDFTRLLEDIRARGVQDVSDVVFLWALDSASSPETTLTDLERTQVVTCGAVLSLVQAMTRASIRARISLVTESAQPVGSDPVPLAVAQSSLWGLGRAISVEHPELWGRLIDLDPAAADLAAAEVLSEIDGHDDEDQIAFRSGRRFVARLVPAESGVDEPVVSCSADATYLVTGALGLLGLKIAQYLADRGARHVVLVGRRGLPDRSEWVPVSGMSELGAQIDAVRALESRGVAVEIVAADVADQARMTALFERFGRELPRLAGIVHAASAMDSASMLELSHDALFNMLRPKVLGTWVLHRLTEASDLDFFVLFSSLSALLGSAKTAHYAAANSFLDSFAHDRRAKGLPAVSVNWGSWDTMRSTAEHQRAFLSSGVRPMHSESALAIFGQSACGQRAQIAAASVDWATFKAVYEAKRRRPVLDGLQTSAVHVEPQARDVVAELDAASAEDRLPLLRAHIRGEAAQVLGLPLDEIDPRKGLFDLGMDSLMSVELKRRLESGLCVSLPTTLTFKYPTVSALADFLASLVIPSNGDSPAKQIAQEAPAIDDDDLSEDELASLLAERLEQIR